MIIKCPHERDPKTSKDWTGWMEDTAKTIQEGFGFGEVYQSKQDKNAVFIADTLAHKFALMEGASHLDTYHGEEMTTKLPWGKIENGHIAWMELHYIGPDEMETRWHRAAEHAKKWRMEHPEAYK